MNELMIDLVLDSIFPADKYFVDCMKASSSSEDKSTQIKEREK